MLCHKNNEKRAVNTCNEIWKGQHSQSGRSTKLFILSRQGSSAAKLLPSSSPDRLSLVSLTQAQPLFTIFLSWVHIQTLSALISTSTHIYSYLQYRFLLTSTPTQHPFLLNVHYYSTSISTHNYIFILLFLLTHPFLLTPSNSTHNYFYSQHLLSIPKDHKRDSQFPIYFLYHS